ncbi:ABC transporter permease [Parabacteroides sp. TM07-1AC]|uniref:ABC transporter permease n=1 Tax=Parabacteroides sp. TM07-1AC TaxID=2292363 RepID=UPI000EFE13A0|nr:ABC transporter permease [Parabacteroides sp. TM07-1AC]RHU23328.1 ABC transporter permease [Parabacteroides sp. TM07-1AC]
MKIILLAIRSLMRFRLYTVINVLGLALSLACVIIISRYVYSEATTDHFNKNHERMFLSVRHWGDQKQKAVLFTTDNALLKKNYVNPLDIPEIEQRTSFVSISNTEIKVDEKLFKAHILATDTFFLRILDYPLIAGNREQLLSTPQEAVVTQQFARRLFGKENPVGKSFDYNGNILTIKGIIGETETQSSLHFDVLISKALQWRWPPVNYFSIALAHPGVDSKQINEKLKGNFHKAGSKSFFFQVMPLDKLYMDKAIDKGQDTFRQGNADSVKILTFVAILLLVIGVFNFIHISSVVIIKRGRELGMKKVFGARPMQLFIQLYAENWVLTAIALFIGWVFIEITQPIQVNQLDIIATVGATFNLLLTLGLLIGLPLLITLYPFFNYSYRQTIRSLQGITPGKNKIGSRSLFLVAQYVITCCLIISSLFFMKQLDFMLNADLGYRTLDIIKAWFMRPTSQMSYGEEDKKRSEAVSSAIRDAIQASPLFQSFSYGESPYELADDPFSRVKMRALGGEWHEVLQVKLYNSFFDVYEIPVSADRYPQSEKEVLINETARKLFSQQGQAPTELETEGYDGVNSLLIKGFTPEFQVVHLSQHNQPIVMTFKDVQNELFWPGKLMASIVPGRRQEAIQFLKELHDKTIGGEFEYTFVEDEISAMYEKDRLVARIYSVFTLISILISSMGLFSLSLFDIQQRYKEIAIRKVNGATVETIINLLLRKYYRLLGLSFIIATPLSWLAITKYMENFANKAPLSWWIFAVAFLITACISLLTLIWQIRKAARTNPAISIKTE